MKKITFKHTHPRTVVLAALVILVLVIVGWVFIEKSNWRAETIRQENIAYCNTANKQQLLDFYRPEDSQGQALPLVVYVHGGGWRWGSKNNAMFNNYAPIFLEHAIAVASINYRLNSAHPYPDQNNDIACAVTYLAAHANELHIDSSRMIFMGESAGAELASYAALNSAGRHYPEPIGVIDFYGVTDFTKVLYGKHPDLNARRYLGSAYGQVALQASPITYITAHAPQFLIIHGQHDNIVPPEQSQLLQNALTSVGVPSTYIKIPDASHSFVGPELAPSDYKIILDGINTFLQQIVGR